MNKKEIEGLKKSFSHMSKKDWKEFDKAEDEGATDLGCHLEV